jgi:hypothetical protein
MYNTLQELKKELEKKLKFTKSYAISDETEFEVTVTNDGCNRTLSICTYWKGEKIPLYTQTTSDLTVSFVTRSNVLFQTISQIMQDIPKAEKALDLMLDDWKFKEFNNYE